MLIYEDMQAVCSTAASTGVHLALRQAVCLNACRIVWLDCGLFRWLVFLPGAGGFFCWFVWLYVGLYGCGFGLFASQCGFYVYVSVLSLYVCWGYSAG